MKNLKIENLKTIISNHTASGEVTALQNEFKISLNAYLEELVSSPIRSLSDAIAFNQKHADLVSAPHSSKLKTDFKMAHR